MRKIHGVESKLIIVVGSPGYAIPFMSLGLKITTQFQALRAIPLKQIAFVLFTGGEDVSPYMYGGRDCGISYVNPVRDKIEMSIFDYCVEKSIKMVGICRGFQILNVLCGGRMYQHLDHHGLVGRHSVYFPHIDKSLLVSSTHHQLVQLPNTAVPIAWSDPKRSDKYVTPDGEVASGAEAPKHEMEAAVFPHWEALGVQYHPEAMMLSEPGRQHFTLMVRSFLKLPTDDFVKHYGREPKDEHREEEGRQGSPAEQQGNSAGGVVGGEA